MTKRHVNTFSGGIDRDTSVNKYDNTHYYDAENLRPISNDTFTSGSMSNVDGLKDKIDGITKIHGQVFKVSNLTGIVKIIPLFHPAVATYDPRKLETLKKDFQILKEEIEK